MHFDGSDPHARPFLKWAGGKRSLLPDIYKRIPDFTGTYIEPFMGAGASLLSIPVKVPRIGNDFNPELIEVYVAIRDSLQELVEELSKHKYEKDYYYEVRKWDRTSSYSKLTAAQRAARFIYLNKSCYNGLYRVNSKGQFNVPFGQQGNPKIHNLEHLKRISQILNGLDAAGNKAGNPVKLKSGDYREITSLATREDFVYLDPPYDPLTPSSSFVSYHKEGFSSDNQIELRDELIRLTLLGVPILMSNSDTKFIQKIYRAPKLFKIEKVQVRRSVGAQPSSRGMISEVLVSNFGSIKG